MLRFSRLFHGIHKHLLVILHVAFHGNLLSCENLQCQLHLLHAQRLTFRIWTTPKIWIILGILIVFYVPTICICYKNSCSPRQLVKIHHYIPFDKHVIWYFAIVITEGVSLKKSVISSVRSNSSNLWTATSQNFLLKTILFLFLIKFFY